LKEKLFLTIDYSIGLIYILGTITPQENTTPRNLLIARQPFEWNRIWKMSSYFGHFIRMAWILLLVSTGILSACSSAGKVTDAASAIDAYNQALVSKNTNQLSNLSCKAWEAEARNELESFAAVTARLENPNCQVSGQDGDYTLVSCTGKIVANYNGENQEIDLSQRTYKAIQEDGQWRMCGYK
jgi:hypothetical protein